MEALMGLVTRRWTQGEGRERRREGRTRTRVTPQHSREVAGITYRNHLPTKFHFSSDFDHLIFKMIENKKFLRIERKC